MAAELNRSEKSLLRQLASEAWEAELTDALDELFERFCIWADNGISAMDLSEEIHQFHNGVSRELYKIYATLPPHLAVTRAIAMGILSAELLDQSLREKLPPLHREPPRFEAFGRRISTIWRRRMEPINVDGRWFR